MANLTGLLNTARDALSAQSYGLSLTGQNIANASTPMYSRREVVLQTRMGGNAGVEVQGTRQIIDRYADTRLLAANGLDNAASERNALLGTVEAVFNDFSGSGLSDSLSALYGSFETLSARPNDPIVRSHVLSSAEDFSASVREIGGRLAGIRSNLLTQAQDVTEQVNGIAKELASLNQQIVLVDGTQGDASSLIDKRSQQLVSLSELIDVRPVYASDGTLMVQASGTTLVEGTNARTLGIELGTDGSMRLIARDRPGGATSDITAHLSGGQLAALREVRDDDVASIQASFDNLVFDVGSSVNASHIAGFGLDGGTGRLLFALPATAENAALSLQVSSDVLGRPERIAASADTATLPSGAENARAMAELATRPLTASSTRTPEETYAEFIGDVGLRKATASHDVVFRQAIREQAESFRSSVSGVSLDEEMIALTRYQTAYQAASKLLSTVNQLLNELIQKVG